MQCGKSCFGDFEIDALDSSISEASTRASSSWPTNSRDCSIKALVILAVPAESSDAAFALGA